MIGRLFGIEADGPIAYLGGELRTAWPGYVVLLLIGAAVVLSVLLYRRQRLASRGKRLTLATLRAIVLSLLLVLLFEPVLAIESSSLLRRNVLVLLDVSQSMQIADARRTPAQVLESARKLDLVAMSASADTLSDAVRTQAAQATRIDLARSLLGHERLGVFRQLDRRHRTRYFTFGSTLASVEGEAGDAITALQQVEPDAPATALGAAVEDAASHYGGQPIAGIILLTDGGSNLGVEPLDVARRMGVRDVPIYPIGIGLPDPPDLAVQQLIVPETVFLRDNVPLRAQIHSRGFAGRRIDLTATFDGQTVARQPVELTGGTQFVDLPFIPERRTGSLNLEVAATVLPGEITADNNRLTRSVRVIDEKIKVLYIEGKPRWEYRYLRQVLLRDHRLDVRFLMTEGDRDLAGISDRYLIGFPDDGTQTFVFDLIIIGDVPARYFTSRQLQRMEQLVTQRGGSLLMLAGQQHNPGSYAGTPIEAMMPVTLRGLSYERLDEAVYVTPTAAGLGSFAELTQPERDNEALWALVRPMFRVPALGSPKPGATVLATLSDTARRREPYPLIAWQRYGSGKSMFVGTDQLWRLRFMRGDEHHARFWGQAIQFLTLSRLLGENRRVRIEMSGSDFKTGQRIPVYANVLNESYEPVRSPSYSLTLEPLDRPGARSQTVELEATPDTPGLYQGFVTVQDEGRYRLLASPTDRAEASIAEFNVADVPLEFVDPAMQRETLERMAELSGGRYFQVQDLAELPERITGEPRTILSRQERELWDLPLILVLVVTLTGVEWSIRRRNNLV